MKTRWETSISLITDKHLVILSKGLSTMPWAKTRASPNIRKWLVLTSFGVAARIGASIVARLANIPDISCIERLASTNSGPQRMCVSLCYGLLVRMSMAFAAVICVIAPVLAQDWKPSRTIEFVVGAGSG